MTPIQVTTGKLSAGLWHPESKKYSAGKPTTRMVTLPEQPWLHLAQRRDCLGKSAVVFPNQAAQS